MRHLSNSLAATVALGLAVLMYMGTDRATAQPPAKPKVTKAPVPGPASFGTADALTQEELKVYLYFLASDQMEGRNFPSRGYDAAALYVASHLAEWGLKPGGSTSGTNGPLQPYFMPMELVATQIVPEQTKLTLTAPPAPAGRGGFGGDAAAAGEGRAGRGGAELVTTNFEYSKDWTYGQAGAFAGGGRGATPEALDADANLVFAGNGYVINKTKINPYEGIDVKGKLIVVAG